MMLEAALLLVAALAVAEPPSARLPSLPNVLAAPAYLSVDRAVDNWRIESAFALDLAPMAAIRLAAGGDLAQTPRCVKLNNYWCIKRGGWVGEIAADGEGHVAFATADDGAAVAALLLRRYYVDYKRHSARAIVSRWAPARCVATPEAVHPGPGVPVSTKAALPKPALPMPPAKPAAAATVSPKPVPPPAAAPLPQRAEQMAPALKQMMPQRVVSMGVAPRGIENTLRARWLSAHGRGGVVPASKARSATAKSRRTGTGGRLALEPAPAIAVGMGEPLDAAPASPGARPADLPRTIDLCIGERERLANYAARVIAGVVGGPDDDLALFSADGAPTDNLAKVMANMAAVEIGPLRASNGLIASGVAQMTRLLARPKAASSTKVAPVADNAPVAPVRE